MTDIKVGDKVIWARGDKREWVVRAVIYLTRDTDVRTIDGYDSEMPPGRIVVASHEDEVRLFHEDVLAVGGWVPRRGEHRYAWERKEV